MLAPIYFKTVFLSKLLSVGSNSTKHIKYILGGRICGTHNGGLPSFGNLVQISVLSRHGEQSIGVTVTPDSYSKMERSCISCITKASEQVTQVVVLAQGSNDWKLRLPVDYSESLLHCRDSQYMCIADYAEIFEGIFDETDENTKNIKN